MGLATQGRGPRILFVRVLRLRTFGASLRMTNVGRAGGRLSRAWQGFSCVKRWKPVQWQEPSSWNWPLAAMASNECAQLMIFLSSGSFSSASGAI